MNRRLAHSGFDMGNLYQNYSFYNSVFAVLRFTRGFFVSLFSHAATWQVTSKKQTKEDFLIYICENITKYLLISRIMFILAYNLRFIRNLLTWSKYVG